jgi:1,4-dihydroxy-2-naphthoate octaprenyltransferase
MQSPHGDLWRNLHDGLWVLSVATTIAGVAAAFWHLEMHHANSFLGSILLAIVIIFVGTCADGEWGKDKNQSSTGEKEQNGSNQDSSQS